MGYGAWHCCLSAVWYVFLRLDKKKTISALHLLDQKEWPKILFISCEKINAVLLLSVHGYLVDADELGVALQWPTAEIYRLHI